MKQPKGGQTASTKEQQKQKASQIQSTAKRIEQILKGGLEYKNPAKGTKGNGEMAERQLI